MSSASSGSVAVVIWSASAYGENAIFRLSTVFAPLPLPLSFWPQPAIRPSAVTRDNTIATTFFMYIPSR